MVDFTTKSTVRHLGNIAFLSLAYLFVAFFISLTPLDDILVWVDSPFFKLLKLSNLLILYIAGQWYRMGRNEAFSFAKGGTFLRGGAVLVGTFLLFGGLFSEAKRVLTHQHDGSFSVLWLFWIAGFVASVWWAVSLLRKEPRGFMAYAREAKKTDLYQKWEQTDQRTVTCEYCGAINMSDELKCTGCGAPLGIGPKES